MIFTDYQIEVMFLIQSNLFSGEERESRLKECYIRHNPGVSYSYYYHIETLHNLMTKLYKNSKQDISYEEVLEGLLDEINSTFIGFKRYGDLSVLDIQYMYIVVKLSEAKTQEFLK